MLSDSERRRLSEIESWLREHDPVFVQRFDSPSRARSRAVFWMMLLLAATVIVYGLAAGNVPSMVGGLVGVGATIGSGLWIRRRRRRHVADG